MKVHQFLTSFAYGDAIGNEAWEIRNFLREQGHQSEIFALFHHPKYAHEVHNYLEYDAYSSPDNVVIFHFSIGSPVSKKFLRLPDRKVMIYHNITPHHFFLDYHRVLSKDCYKGRIELKQFADKVDLALGDSEYNRLELVENGFADTGVLPLVIDFDKFNQPISPVFRDLFADGKDNLIYVGRIIPNKKIEDIIKVFHLYQKLFNPASRLFLVGEHRGFERYLSALQGLCGKLETKNVHFLGHLPLNEMVSCLKLSRLYLQLSEHEGFCAPLVEAFHLGLPVIAYAAGAVEETMSGAGLLVRKKEHRLIAGLVDRLLSDRAFYRQVQDSQAKALEKYRRHHTGRILLEHLERLFPE